MNSRDNESKEQEKLEYGIYRFLGIPNFEEDTKLLLMKHKNKIICDAIEKKTSELEKLTPHLSSAEYKLYKGYLDKAARFTDEDPRPRKAYFKQEQEGEVLPSEDKDLADEDWVVENKYVVKPRLKEKIQADFKKIDDAIRFVNLLTSWKEKLKSCGKNYEVATKFIQDFQNQTEGVYQGFNQLNRSEQARVAVLKYLQTTITTLTKINQKRAAEPKPLTHQNAASFFSPVSNDDTLNPILQEIQEEIAKRAPSKPLACTPPPPGMCSIL